MLLSLALHAPALGWGFFLDDHGQRLVFEGQALSPTMTRFNVFDFGYAPAPGEPLYEGGGFPWWTSPGWKARFFRPLASWSMALDTLLFGRRAVLHHLSSLALYALVLLFAHRLYARTGLAARAVALALAVFALEDGSVFVVGWLANRNSLLEGLFAALGVGLALDVSGRTGGRAPYTSGGADAAAGGARVAAAVACGALATLAKESGVASLAVIALLLWCPGPADRAAGGERVGTASRLARRLGAAVAAGLVLAHLAFLFLGDYGVRAAMYPAPWLEGGLVPWLENLAVTLALQPLAMLSPLPIDLLAMDPLARRATLAIGALVTPLVARAVWRRARALPGAGWLALWGLLALLPQSLAPASDRLVFVPALAWAPLVGCYLDGALPRPIWRGLARPARAPLAAGLLVALGLSAAMLAARALQTGPLMASLEQVIVEAELEPLTGPPEEGARDVLVLQYPNEFSGFAGGGAWAFETGDRRTRWFSLQLLGRGLEWTRVDERTLEISSLDGPFTRGLFESVFLDSLRVPEVGQRWRASRFEVEALAVEGGGPSTLRLRWDTPLEGPEAPVLLCWDGQRLARVTPPAVGRTELVPRAERLVPYLP